MSPRARIALAALSSGSVYAVPLLGPHSVSLLGEWLVRSATRGQRAPAWIALEIAGALAMQAAAGLLWYWILGRPRSARMLLVLVAAPLWTAFAHGYYLAALPARFLIERDVAPERRAWAVACTIPGQALVVPGEKPAVVRGDDVLLASDATGRLSRVAVTRAPGGATTCTLPPLGLSPSTAHDTAAWIGDGGRMLISSIARETGAQSWRWIAEPGRAAMPLAAPEGRRPNDGAPVISHDGTAIGWLTPVSGSGQPPAFSVVIRPLPPVGGRDDVVINLAALGRASFVLRDVDPVARAVLVAMNERAFATLGYDGAVLGDPIRPPGVEPLHMTFRRVGAGWVAWDGYTEDGYAIAWSLPAGRGRHPVLRGRGITDVAVHAEGGLIALSVTTSLSIGEVRDAVYVLRVADGAEVFRRYLPRYARSAVFFPGSDLFAYTEFDGTRATALVLQIPPDALR